MSIEVKNITKRFGGFTALHDVSLSIPDGELVALLGPSGSGKTTLLRIIAGLETPEAGSGDILFHGQSVTGSDAGKRGIGFVFQHYALFRHMTVFENVAFGLRVRPRATRPDGKEITDRVHRLLKLIQLENMAERYPSQLSGGQRQRIALARALAVEPRVLLLDEPFGALDAKVRQDLRRWLRKLHDEIHVTSLFVTHDQEEAMEVADRVVVMNGGKIEQVGAPDDIFHRPASEFVIDFIGQVNLFHGRMEGDRIVLHESAGSRGPANEDSTKIFVRPHDLEIHPVHPGYPAIPAKIVRIQSAGPLVKIELAGERDEAIHVELPHDRFAHDRLRTGMTVHLTPRQARVFAEDYSI